MSLLYSVATKIKQKSIVILFHRIFDGNKQNLINKIFVVSCQKYFINEYYSH